MADRRVVVLYGTQTGNSQDVAKRIGREAKAYGLQSTVRSINKYDMNSLPSERLVLFVVATTGQGDIPDSMKSFWKTLFRRSLADTCLNRCRFAVFGLGDSAYIKFNVVAKKLHNRLRSLGARPVTERGLGDDQAEGGYEEALDPWLDTFWNELSSTMGLQLNKNRSIIDDCPFRVEARPENEHPEPDTAAEWSKESIEYMRRVTMEEKGDSQRSMLFPFFASVKENKRITSPEHFQDTRHIVLDTVDSGLRFQPGDVLAMHALTPWESIDAFCKRLGLDPHARIAVTNTESQTTSIVITRSLIQGLLDVASASPRRFFFEILSHFASDSREKERLRYFASPQGREEMALYNRQACRTVLEVLLDFPSTMPPLNWLMEACPRKTPRRFSIASSPLAFPGEIHLLVAIVEYRTKNRRMKRGLCTSYLSNLRPDCRVPCWTEPGSLSFNEASSSSLLLFGPGTGVAPFRSILQERRCLSIQNPSYRPPPSYLFFGGRNEGGDFYYGDEWNRFKDSAILDTSHGLITAFSRDQREKIYVTHRIAEHGSIIHDLLRHRGAYVFVAGSANKMPSDVRNAIRRVLEIHGHLSFDFAEQFLKQLEQKGRYQVEAWS